MEKLELKHLAPYLPYDLGIGSLHSHNENRYYAILKLTHDYGLSNGVGNLINGKTIHGTYIKPILRPLSDLTNDVLSHFNFITRPTSGSDFDLYSYEFIKYCCENHYDFQGLIEANLAIDINTLKQE